MEMPKELYSLLMNSNQIVHNRGRALAYFGNADKKRKRDETELSGDEEHFARRKEVHKYELKTQLGFKPAAVQQ